MSDTTCTLVVSAVLFQQEPERTSAVRAKAKRSDYRFPALPRAGDRIQIPYWPQCRTGEAISHMHLTVKEVTHQTDEQGRCIGYEINCGGAAVDDKAAFDRGVDKWKKAGFTVTVTKDRP